MQPWVTQILESRWSWRLSRVLLSVIFAASGVAKVIAFESGMAEMEAAGLYPAWLFNVLVAVVLLFGSFCLLLDRQLWLGAAVLSAFLVLTILIVHTFWAMPQPKAQISMYFALEHLTVIGGLIAAAIASHYRRTVVSMPR